MAITLQAQPRTVSGKKVASLRQESMIPAILYGFGQKESQNIAVNYQAFEKVYNEAGESQVVELGLEGGKQVDVLIREVQIHPVTRDYIHTDFQAIDVNTEVEVEVPLEFIGEAPAVKTSGGSLVKSLTTLAVSCLPKNLVKSLAVPLDKLKTIEDVILVSDIEIPETLKVLNDPEELIATVSMPKLEVEPVAPAAEAAPAEGAAPAAPAAETSKE